MNIRRWVGVGAVTPELRAADIICGCIQYISQPPNPPAHS